MEVLEDKSRHVAPRPNDGEVWVNTRDRYSISCGHSFGVNSLALPGVVGSRGPARVTRASMGNVGRVRSCVTSDHLTVTGATLSWPKPKIKSAAERSEFVLPPHTMSSSEKMAKTLMDRAFDISASTPSATIPAPTSKPDMRAIDESFFCSSFQLFQSAIYANAHDKGFYRAQMKGIPLPHGEKIALMHTELSEAFEAHRAGEPESEKCPGFSHKVEELADTVIRIMDYCEATGQDLCGAMIAKHKYNRTRPFMHGKKF